MKVAFKQNCSPLKPYITDITYLHLFTDFTEYRHRYIYIYTYVASTQLGRDPLQASCPAFLSFSTPHPDHEPHKVWGQSLRFAHLCYEPPEPGAEPCDDGKVSRLHTVEQFHSRSHMKCKRFAAHQGSLAESAIQRIKEYVMGQAKS